MNKQRSTPYKVFLFFALTSILLFSISNSVQGEGAQFYKISYFISINYVPIGSIDVMANPYYMELKVIKYHPTSPQYSQLEQAVFYLLKTSENYCSTGHTGSVDQALTYYVEATREMYVIRASRISELEESSGEVHLQSYSYYPSKYCIPLYGRIKIYRNNVLINELEYTIVSSNSALPGSNSLNSGSIRLFVLLSVMLITIAAFLVISRAGKYRIV
ncbi:MAG: hypothetical protein F7B59_00760 [Desulfurococcales archaeon]|nr:hypothetical protein [Desulfurococcales archaeon]